LNPFLPHHLSQRQPHASRVIRRVGACAAGFAVSISLSLAQDAPAEADPAPADAGLGFGVVPADGTAPDAPAVPNAQGQDLPIIPADPNVPLIPVAAPEGAIIPFNTAQPEAAPVPETVEETAPEPTVESATFFGPNDFDPVFGMTPAATGGFGGGFTAPGRGFSTSPGGFPIGASPYGGLLDGLSLSATLSGTYDSNPSRGFGIANDDGEGDFFMTLGGSIGYQTVGGGDWTFGGRYSGSYSEYFDQSDLSGFGQNLSVFATYQGGPLTVTTTAGLNFGSGANRYYESVVDELSLSLGVNARYAYSAITSFTGFASTSFVMPGGSSHSDTQSYNFGGSMLWRYSPLLEFGPGIRIGMETGDSQEDRVTYGPTLTANYKATDMISLSGVIGLDFVDFEDSGTDGPEVSGSLIVSYRPSDIWGMSLAVGSGTQSDPGAFGNFTQTTFIRLGYNRTLPFATWNAGVSFEQSDSEVPERTAAVGRGDRDYFSIDSSLSMPLFADTCTGSLFVRYSDQSASNTNDGFDSFQLGFSISRSF